MLLALALAAVPVAVPAITAEAPGPVCDAKWHDAARDRDMPVRIRMPAGTGKAPVILFSHGLGGSVEAGRVWAEVWAQAGFVVIHLQHPGSDREAVRSQGLRGSMAPAQLVARAGDVRFAIDQVARHGKTGDCDLARADERHVGVAGHSFGAHTAQAAAGQSFLRTADLADGRVRAAIAFSPAPPMNGRRSDADAFSSIAIPFLSVTGSEDAVPQLTPVKPEDRQRPFRAMAPGGKYLLWLDGANHGAFGGQDRGSHGSAPDAHVRPIVIRATTAFWRWTLMEDPAARAELEGTSAMLGPRDKLEKR
ncbi:alpha/beta hydrolase family protein [Sphingomonas canadensis]|uniref:Alpha/beta hydrolase family protein n=1 Tax=Sphingomonas canadensis TaxID=1219257 RepID=A0ABW3H8U6_9SPHN|nr:dienelactone hydrolase [Sphingomonas canadensis]MCW3836268.1 dienelactone hydrolase [Sphingomonas canadensis]